MRPRLPSPAMTVALVALLVALSGTALAAGVVPLAKRALVADNAKKLGGRSAAQIASIPGPATTLNGKTADDIASTPGPTSTITGTIVVKKEALTIESFQTIDSTVECDAGQKAIGGGFEAPDAAGAVFSFDTRPNADGTAWKLRLGSATDVNVTGQLYAICVK
jgi:hypothetical protein